MDHGSTKTPPATSLTTLSLLPSHHPYDDDVIKSRRITESSNETEKDQDADDPLSNKLFYLGGKRSPRLRQDPEWTSIRSVGSRPSFDVTLRSFLVISGWLDKNTITTLIKICSTLAGNAIVLLI